MTAAPFRASEVPERPVAQRGHHVDANGFQVRLLRRRETADDVARIVEDPKLVPNLRGQKKLKRQLVIGKRLQ